MADSDKDYGTPDNNPRQWGNNAGNTSAPKSQPGNPTPTDIIDHKLQHADYSKLVGDIKSGK